MISIIVPVHNAEKYIEETVASVKAQTYTDWELILVENGSTDGTREVLKRMEETWETVPSSAADTEAHRKPRELGGNTLRILYSGTTCAADARNEGLEAAKGRYIAFLDADDLWKPEKLEWQMEYLQKLQRRGTPGVTPEISATQRASETNIKNSETGAARDTTKKQVPGFFFTSYEFGDENAKGTGKIVRVPETLNYKQALSRTIIFTSTVLVDTEVIPKDLLKMPRIKSEDTATWWQILQTGALAYGLNENLVIYRRAGKTLSSNKLEALRRIWNLYRKVGRLNVLQSAFYFAGWAVKATLRRI